MLTVRRAHTFSRGQEVLFSDGCDFFRLLQPQRLAHSDSPVFPFVQDKSKKTWQMITVLCLILKTPPSASEKGCFGAMRSPPLSSLLNFFSSAHTSTHMYIHLHITEISISSKHTESKRKFAKHTWPRIHSGTWIRDKNEYVRGK